ncbi:hypothetical protein IMCC3317_11460 [Kordia antarctica]|uniref:Small-conductance mechanosensitive channel n=1 Tax=Kordia antarctica TaxID=1218801 RepID=A0A7L4ZGC3_9FLAO|nr:hypothetical protein [Kordia antarctica]QHI35798.1 hypothetical protein IMCC3317_11460 [Kordia antarctica]
MTYYLANFIFLFKVILLILLVLGIMMILRKLVPKFIKSTKLRQQFILISGRFLLIYKIVAGLVVIAIFVQSNYIVHGGMLLVVIAISFSFIQSFLSGIVFQWTNVVCKGSRLVIGDVQGAVVRFSPFGIFLNSIEGEQFINYREIDEKGYTTIYKEDGSIIHSIQIETELSEEKIKDLLFETPIVNYEFPPKLVKMDTENHWKLSFELEDGVKKATIISYLNQHKINTTIIN